jgi:threonine dehydrogenase-like Zn-dependent dehydrogenase
MATIAYLEGPRALIFRDEVLPAPGPGQILCHSVVSVISPGTEVAAWAGLPPLRPGRVYPRLVGYCNVAEVLAVGEGVIHVAPGARILSYASHRTHFLLDEAQVLLVLDDGMDSLSVAATYLFHLGYNAIIRSSVRAGSRVLVLGLGALGLTSVAIASIAGAQVRAISDQSRSAGIAIEYGAQGVHGRNDLEGLTEAWGGHKADVVVATTGGWDDWRLALQAAAAHGTIAVLGFPGRGEAPPSFNPLDSQYFYDKQLRIEAVGMSPEREDSKGFLRFNERANLAYLAGLIQAGKLRPEAIISARFPGLRLAEAYSALEARDGSPITFALEWRQ